MYRYFFKRLFDILFSGLGLILLSPVFLILAIIVRIKHGSPVIFCQLRPGKNNKIFKLRKFRSMTNAKDENGNLLPDKDRLTKFGKLLRTSNLDELPQLWNIFIGNMSFIGPRPKLIKDVVFFNEEQNLRNKVRPGIVGWAQVNGRNEVSWEEVFKFDKEYVNSKNLFWMDIKVLFKTVALFFKKNKAEESGSANNNDYYYPDYLKNRDMITKEEYDAGLEKAKLIAKGEEKL